MLLKLVLFYELDRLIEDTRHTQHLKQLEWQFHPLLYDEGDSAAQWLRAIGIPMAAGEVGVFIHSQHLKLMQLMLDRDGLGILAP